MPQKTSEEEIRRFNRELAGHLNDRDRERFKRKRAGLPPLRERPRKGGRHDRELEELEPEAGEE